jgi:hypothetical protein
MPSPDGKIEAVVFKRDCGATTDFTTQISILRKGASLPNQAGNAFTADTNHGAAPAARWGGPPADVRWITNRQVSISFHRASRVSFQQRVVSVPTGLLSHEDVKVEYSPSLQ